MVRSSDPDVPGNSLRGLIVIPENSAHTRAHICLVEFEPGMRIGLIRLTGLEFELSEILGHKVDLNGES